MPPVVAASRHAVKSSVSAPNASIWFTNDQLWDAFDRLTSLLSVSTRKRRRRADNQCIRYSSNVPGPLEARRRLARRHFNNVSSSLHSFELGPPPPPPPHAALLLGIPNGLFTEPYMPPQWKWQAPGSKLPDSPTSPPLPSWLLPPKPPASYHDPSFPASNLADLLLKPSEKIKKISVTEYQDHLVGIETLAQLQGLHDALGNVTLEAAFCSSVAFDHLFSKHQHNRSLGHIRGNAELTPLADLLNFVQDEKLEHTNGANLAKLAGYMAKGNCSTLERQILIELIENGINGDVVFSAQALAGLYRCIPLFVHAASSDQTSHRIDTPKLISATFLRRITQHAEVLPPTLSDLINLNHIANDLAGNEDNGTTTLFILERIVYGLQTGNVVLYQLPQILSEIALSKQSTTRGLRNNPTLQYLRDIWTTREEHLSHPSTRVYLIGPILRIVNLLPVTRSTMSFTCDLIREHASHGKLSSKALKGREMQSSMGYSIRRFLFYDKLLPEPLNITAQEPPNRLTDTQNQDVPPPDAIKTSSLTELLNTLPSFYAEQWIIQTPAALIRDLSVDKRDEALQTINAWLDAVFSCHDHEWSDWKISRHPVWRSVLWQLSRAVKPAEVLANFQQTPGYHICEILIETWIRREVEKDISGRGDRLLPTRVDPNTLIHWLQLHTRSQKKRIEELQAKSTDVTLKTLSYRFEYWYLRRLYKLGEWSRWTPSSSAYLALLKAVQLSGLERGDHLTQLLELTFLRGRPGAVEGLVHFSRLELSMALTHKGRKIVEAHISRSAHTAPGRALGIFKSHRAFSLSRLPGFLQVLITARKSHVHPRTILRLLWQSDPAAGLPRGHPNRTRSDCSLSRSRVDLVHEAALAFANGSRFSTRSAWRCVLHCLRYLCYHNAPLDSRISKALVICCILRSLRDPSGRPIQQDWLNFCVNVVERVEGEDTADAVLRMVHKYEQSYVHNRKPFRS